MGSEIRIVGWDGVFRGREGKGIEVKEQTNMGAGMKDGIPLMFLNWYLTTKVKQSVDGAIASQG